MEKVIYIKFLRKGLQFPIWGLMLNDDEVFAQYPAKTLGEAVSFFSTEYGYQLRELGYTRIMAKDNGTEIVL